MDRFRQIAVAAALTVLGGYVDAAGYLALAHLFVAHMSGNSVRAAVEMAGGNLAKAASYGIPVACFVVSAMAGAALSRVHRAWPLALECVLLAAFDAFAHVLPLAGGDAGFGRVNTAMGSLLVFTLGLQNTVLKKKGIGEYRGTTFITGMLASLGETAVDWAAKRTTQPEEARKAGVECARFARRIGIYLAGALVGGLAFVWFKIDAFDAAVAAVLVLAAIEWFWPANDDVGD